MGAKLHPCLFLDVFLSSHKFFCEIFGGFGGMHYICKRLMKLNFAKDDKRNLRKETSVRRCDRCGVFSVCVGVYIAYDDSGAYGQEYRF